MKNINLSEIDRRNYVDSATLFPSVDSLFFKQAKSYMSNRHVYNISDEQLDSLICELKEDDTVFKNLKLPESLNIFNISWAQLNKLFNELAISHLVSKLYIINNSFNSITNVTTDDIIYLFNTTVDVSAKTLNNELRKFIRAVLLKLNLSWDTTQFVYFDVIVPFILNNVNFVNLNFLEKQDIKSQINYDQRSDKTSVLNETLNTMVFLANDVELEFNIPEKFITDNIDFLDPRWYFRLYTKMPSERRAIIKEALIKEMEQFIKNSLELSSEELSMLNIHVDLDMDAYSLFSEVTSESKWKSNLQLNTVTMDRLAGNISISGKNNKI